MWILSFAGTKLGQMVVIALAVGLGLYLTIQYIQLAEKDKVINQIKLETLENDISIRENVDERLRENREANPTRDGTTALDLLRNRQTNQ